MPRRVISLATSSQARFALISLTLLAGQFHRASSWLLHTFGDATYDSWGFLPLLIIAFRICQQPPRLRPRACGRYLGATLACASADVALSGLRLNILSALLMVLATHFWAMACFEIRGCWYLKPQLYVALLCLPAVYWANVIVGLPLQRLVASIGAASIRSLGLPVVADGTLLRLPDTIIAVDTACSGFKMLYAGLLFGLLVQPPGMNARSRLVFWLSLLPLLLAANVLRVVSLALSQVYRAAPLDAGAHQAVGLIAFALCCACSLLILRWLDRRARNQACGRRSKRAHIVGRASESLACFGKGAEAGPLGGHG